MLERLAAYMNSLDGVRWQIMEEIAAGFNARSPF